MLNLYERLPLNPNDPQIMQEYAPDGVHFNDKGHRILAELLIDYLENEISD